MTTTLKSAAKEAAGLAYELLLDGAEKVTVAKMSLDAGVSAFSVNGGTPVIFDSPDVPELGAVVSGRPEHLAFEVLAYSTGELDPDTGGLVVRAAMHKDAQGYQMVTWEELKIK